MGFRGVWIPQIMLCGTPQVADSDKICLPDGGCRYVCMIVVLAMMDIRSASGATWIYMVRR